MISDEERKAIDYLQLCYDLSTITNESLSKLCIVLNLIKRQSKEIEHLKRPKYIIDCKTNEITTLTNDFISKNKIKAKIEEYKKQIAKMEKDDVGIGFTLGKEWSDLKAKIEFGQSLLEKE